MPTVGGTKSYEGGCRMGKSRLWTTDKRESDGQEKGVRKQSVRWRNQSRMLLGC